MLSEEYPTRYRRLASDDHLVDVQASGGASREPRAGRMQPVPASQCFAYAVQSQLSLLHCARAADIHGSVGAAWAKEGQRRPVHSRTMPQWIELWIGSAALEAARDHGESLVRLQLSHRGYFPVT